MNYRSVRVYRDVSGYAAERRVDRAYAAARRFERVSRGTEARLRFGHDSAYERARSFFGRVSRVLDQAGRSREVRAEDWALLGLARDVADEMTMSHGVRRAALPTGVLGREALRRFEREAEEAEARDFIRLGAEAYEAAERFGRDGGGAGELLLF